MFAFDLEANDWNRFRVAALVTSQGDEETFTKREDLADTIEDINDAGSAHYGGRYDFFFLPPLKDVSLSGSGILRGRLGKARLTDSWFLFQMSLEKIAKAIGMKKLENRSNRVEELTDDEATEHALNDARILLEAKRRHAEWCLTYTERPPATAGGTAIAVAEYLEPSPIAHMRSYLMAMEDWWAHQPYASGGRVEIFQHGIAPSVVYTYDINSSYPFAWTEGPIPLGPWAPIGRRGKRGHCNYKIDVKQNRKMLPIVATDGMWKHDGIAHVTDEELGVLESSGAAFKILAGWESETVGNFGARFALEMYALKQRGDPWAKVSVNSLHGKFGQQLLFRGYPNEDESRLELSLLHWYQRPLIEAWILARARLRLWRAMQAITDAGFRVYYCDTDCVHTDCPPEHFPSPISDALGAWKKEQGPCNAIYVAPKVYCLSTGTETKIVSKGFSKRIISEEHLLRAVRGEKVRISMREGLIGFRSLKGWRPEVKEITRTLSLQTGGKIYHGKRNRNDAARLHYPR